MLFAIPHDEAAKARARNWTATFSANGVTVHSPGVSVTFAWSSFRQVLITRRIVLLRAARPNDTEQLIPRRDIPPDALPRILDWAQQAGVQLRLVRER